ncbi:MAG: VanZ family protein [Burkholderiales bacterium]|nr:VanZ family protein [Burkholderiales bacterium]
MTVADDRRRRGLLGAGAVAYLAFVVYGSLVPLQFTPHSMEEACRSFRNMAYVPPEIGARADWATNVLLFIPLSFLLAGAADLNSRWRWPRMLGVLAFCFGLSATIEFLQIFFPPRVVSLNDIVAESFGALVGIALWLWRGPWVCKQVLGWAEATHRRGRALYLFYAYLLGLAIFSLLPLDLTLSGHDIYDKWKEGRLVLVPFGFRYGSLRDLVVDLALDLATWMPVGILASYARVGSRRQVLLYCIGLAALLEFLQVFVYSRIADVTDILTAALGCSIGMVLGDFVRTAPESAAEPHPAQVQSGGGIPRTWLWAIVYSLGLLAAFWYPFDFRFDAATARARFDGMWAAPLGGLYFQSEIQAISNIALKAGLFAPLGVLLAMGVARWRGGARTIAIFGAAIFVVTLAFVIELGQILLPAKYPDVTDVVLGTGGAFLAALLVTGPREFFPGWGRGPRRARLSLVLVYAMCVAGVWAVTHWPRAPYNVRELLRPGLGVLSAALLGLAIPWLFAFPALAAAGVRNADAFKALYRWPALLALHAAVAYLLIRLAVPDESIADIAGTPILGDLRELEWMGRTMVLIAAVAWLLFVGGLTACGSSVLRATGPQTLAVALVISTLLLPFAHWVIVVQAATDNLTELMRDGGGPAASAILSCCVILLGATGAWVARIFKSRSAVRVPAAFVLLLASSAAGFWLVTAGTEGAIVKYGKVFSALQFLLSTDRNSYAGGSVLLVRFCLVYMGAALALAFAYGWVLPRNRPAEDRQTRPTGLRASE